MLLSVHERLLLPNLLPPKGGIDEIRRATSIGGKVDFSQEEAKELELKHDGQATTWEKQKDLEIEFSALETALIVSRLDELNSKKELTRQMLSLYDKFIGDDSADDGKT